MAPVRVRSQPPGSSRSYRMPRQVPRSTAGETLPQPPVTATQPPVTATSLRDGYSASRERQGERSSQTRAREREARRALKTLTAALPQIPAPEREQVPTRRQLRQQQLQRENPGLAPDAGRPGGWTCPYRGARGWPHGRPAGGRSRTSALRPPTPRELGQANHQRVPTAARRRTAGPAPRLLRPMPRTSRSVRRSKVAGAPGAAVTPVGIRSSRRPRARNRCSPPPDARQSTPAR